MGTLYEFFSVAAKALDSELGFGYGVKYVEFHRRQLQTELLPEHLQEFESGLRDRIVGFDEKSPLGVRLHELHTRLTQPDGELADTVGGAPHLSTARGAAYAELLVILCRLLALAGRPNVEAVADLFVMDIAITADIPPSSLASTPRWPDAPEPFFVETNRWAYELSVALKPELPVRLQGDFETRIYSLCPIAFGSKAELEAAVRDLMREMQHPN